MTLSITCPTCDGSSEMPENVRGKKIFCPRCGASLVVTGAGVAKRSEVGKQPILAAEAPQSSALGFLVLPLAFLLLMLLAGGASWFILERDRETPAGDGT